MHPTPWHHTGNVAAVIADCADTPPAPVTRRYAFNETARFYDPRDSRVAALRAAHDHHDRRLAALADAGDHRAQAAWEQHQGLTVEAVIDAAMCAEPMRRAA